MGPVLKRSQKSRFLCTASPIFSVAVQFKYSGPPTYMCVPGAACSSRARSVLQAWPCPLRSLIVQLWSGLGCSYSGGPSIDLLKIPLTSKLGGHAVFLLVKYSPSLQQRSLLRVLLWSTSHVCMMLREAQFGKCCSVYVTPCHTVTLKAFTSAHLSYVEKEHRSVKHSAFQTRAVWSCPQHAVLRALQQKAERPGGGRLGPRLGPGQPAGAVQHWAGAQVCRAQASLEAGQLQVCRLASGQGQRPVLRGGQPRIKLKLCGSRTHRCSQRCGLTLAPRQETCIRTQPGNTCAAASSSGEKQRRRTLFFPGIPHSQGRMAADKGLPQCAHPTCTASLHVRLKCVCQGHLSKAT